MRKLYYILVLSVLASCHWGDKDSDIFNGEIINIEENDVNKIYVFDWDGRLVSKVTANHGIDEIVVDNINKIRTSIFLNTLNYEEI